MATNNLQLGVEMNTAAANASAGSLNKTFETVEQSAVRMGQGMASGLGHGVTGVQATSAALRTLEGNLQNNLRAAERFLANTLGLGDALKTAFPVIGAVAFGGVLSELVDRAEKLYEAYKKLQELPAKITQEFGELNNSLAISNDQLRVANDRLENEIAKLEHKPGNGLKLALDEARLSADSLADSLDKDLDRVAKLLKENAVGGVAQFLGKAGVSDIEENLKTFRQDVDKITAETQAKLNGVGQKGLLGITIKADPDQVVADQTTALQNRYRQEIQQLTQQLNEAKGGLKSGFDLTGTGAGSGIADAQARIATLTAALKNLTEEYARIGGTATKDQLEKKKDVIDSVKQGLDEIQRLQEESRRALNASLDKSLLGAVAIVEKYGELMTEAYRKSGMSAEAFANSDIAKNYRQAQANEIGTMARKTIDAYQKGMEESAKKEQEQRGKSLEAFTAYDNDVAQRQINTIQKGLDYQEKALAESRDSQLKGLDALNARTVQQKLAVEQQKLAIEQEYLSKSQDLQITKIQGQAQLELDERESVANKALTAAGNNPVQRERINQDLAIDRAGIASQRDEQIAAVRGAIGTQQQEAIDKAAKAQTQVVQEQYQRTYDTVLQQTDSFLEAVEDKTGNAWKRITDNLKKTFENALNNILSSQVAGLLTSLITGISPNGQLGKQGGLVMPAGTGAGGLLGAGLGLARSISGGPGGTSPFAQNPVAVVQAAGGGTSPIALGTQVYGDALRQSEGFGLPPGTRMIGGDGAYARPWGSTSSGASTASSPNGFPVLGDVASSDPSSLAGVLSNSTFNGLAGPGGTPGFAPGPISSGMGGGGGLGSLFNLSGLGKMFGIDTMAKSHGGIPTWDPTNNTEVYPDGTVGAANGTLMGGLGNVAMTAGGMMFLHGITTQGVGLSQGINRIGGGAGLGFGLGSKIPGMTPLTGALAGAGFGIMDDGWNRGGVGGRFEAIGGGALAGGTIGFQYGGPIGAAIGAGIGGLVGLFGSFFKTAMQKVKDQVKQAYGLSVDDSTAQAILNIAKQQYGGDIPMAISSAEVRNMLAMYSQATGQGNGQQIAGKMTSYSVMDTAGGLYNLPSTVDAQAAMNYGGVLPSLAVGRSTPSGLGLMGTGSVNLQLDGPATTALLSGQVAATAPAAVSNAYQSSNNRLNTYATLAAPGVITR